MAPKKTEKQGMIQDLKQKKGVRKRTPNNKFSMSTNLKTQPTVDLSIPNNNNQEPRNLPKKVTESKVANKVNGIKILKTCKALTKISDYSSVSRKLRGKAASVEPQECESGPQKNKKAKFNTEQVHGNNGDEVTEELFNLQEVLPKNKKAKACKQNENARITRDAGVANETTKLDCVPTKIKKEIASKIKKQSRNKKNTILLDEATNDQSNFVSASSKITKRKATPTQNKKNKKQVNKECGSLSNADDNDVPLKIKKINTKAFFKQNQNARKIMLANEVIRSALQKKPKILNNENRPLRSGRKKIICKTDDNVKDANDKLNKMLGDGENIQDVAKKKAIKYVNCGKNSFNGTTLEDAQQQLTTMTSESSVTKKTLKSRRNLSLRRNPKPAVDQTSQNTDTVDEGKKETQESALIENNDTLFFSNETTAPEPSSKTKCVTQSQKPKNITSRKHSGTSTSTCFSWTKDISSSSTITWVTVKSNDFVRIDKRLPVVKLTNVDHQIKRKHFIDNIYEENSRDSHLEKSKCSSDCSSISVTNLNVSQTLNLSTSSLTSVTTNRTAQNNGVCNGNHNERIIKLQKSIENLSHKMKNFDFEIINWIGYENDSKDKNKNVHAQMFDLLNDENDVIRYCKEIKRVLSGDQQSTEIIEKCPIDIAIARHEQQAVDKLPEHIPSKMNTDSSKKQSQDLFEPKKDEDSIGISNCDEVFDNSKSFDKNISAEDNDDDDALSLFAESITGLESSKRNSSCAVSVSNDKNVTQPDLGKTLRANERVIPPMNNVVNKEPVPFQVINKVKKQTADSSTVFNRDSDSNMYNKCQTSKNIGRSVNLDDHFATKRQVRDIRISNKQFQDVHNIVTGNELNKSLNNNSVEFADIHGRSPVDAYENSSNKSSEFQNYRERTVPYSFDNNNISGTPVNVSENLNNGASSIQDDYNAESVGESENSNLEIPSVAQFDESEANHLTMPNKQINVTSSIFKGVCVFNLINVCKNTICTFSHIHISTDFVRDKLQSMNEDMFIKESLYVVNWSMLRLKYSMCFVEEYIRRNLTVSLLHFVKEFIIKILRKNRDEMTLATEIIETTLLHLNEADLEPCNAILGSMLRPNLYMCDKLMKAISETQNFSRFKNVFIKLTLFMCQIGRSVRLDAATQLLERLCILPYDNALAGALMKIIATTRSTIFNVQMMGLLESQLLKNNTQLYEELMTLKLQAARNHQKSAPLPMQSPRIASSSMGNQTCAPIARADSPDTTNTDFLNKSSEPVITRTITINRTINTSNLTTSAGSGSSDDPTKRYEPRQPRTTWRGYRPHVTPHPTPHRPQRHVFNRIGFAPRAFNGSLAKFRRRSPQDPY